MRFRVVKKLFVLVLKRGASTLITILPMRGVVCNLSIFVV